MPKTELNVLAEYKRLFVGEPLVIRSPGRINLIGEHTDYNDGFVLPASIDKSIVLALSPNKEDKIRLRSIDMQPSGFEIDRSDIYQQCGVDWANYILGVVDQLQKLNFNIQGFDCVFGGDVPIGAGLSSSAALEGGVVYGLSELFDLGLSRMEMAKISMRAENDFVGVQCGIMDQFASLHGIDGKVLKLDCRSLDYEYYTFEWDDIRVLLCDTKVRRTLAGSEYNIRREQCEKGVAVIQKNYSDVNSLRDVSLDMLQNHKGELDDIVYKRCRYVVEENIRVHKACEALLRKDLNDFGRLMYASHSGLRDDYEVSCKELDTLVEATERIDGILGSRMMGGGFGGCTINLATQDVIDESKASIASYYKNITGAEPEFHVVKISEGTHIMKASITE